MKEETTLIGELKYIGEYLEFDAMALGLFGYPDFAKRLASIRDDLHDLVKDMKKTKLGVIVGGSARE